MLEVRQAEIKVAICYLIFLIFHWALKSSARPTFGSYQATGSVVIGLRQNNPKSW
jgi:hypothetical protein